MIMAVLLGIGEVFVIAAASTHERGLEWPDYLAMLGPFISLVTIILFFMLLPWQVALVLTFVVIGFVAWGVSRVLKMPSRRHAR
jgi:hypothetical protein